MNRTNEALYSFESKPTRQTEEQARQMLRTFLVRMRVDPDVLESLPEEDRQTLVTYATVCHLNIHWYHRRRQREQSWYFGFACFTVALLAGTPLAIFWAHQAAPQALGAQIGVIAAGLLSAHRTLSTMFEKRNLVKHFWRAEADLKTILYSFEDTWRGRALASTSPVELKREFMDDIVRQIQQARQIKRTEQDEFFAQYESAFSNLGEILGAVQKTSTDTASALTAQKVKQAERIVQVQDEIADLEARAQAIEHDLADLERELADGAARTGTEPERARHAAVLAAVETLHRERLEIKRTLSAARSRYQRLERP